MLYRLLTRTTQPTHLVAIAIFSLVIMTVWPQFIGSGRLTASSSLSSTSESPSVQHDHYYNVDGTNRKHSTLATTAYLCAFAVHFGAQIWMTFVSGKFVV